MDISQVNKNWYGIYAHKYTWTFHSQMDTQCRPLFSVEYAAISVLFKWIYIYSIPAELGCVRVYEAISHQTAKSHWIMKKKTLEH